MTLTELANSSRFIVARNLTPNVAAAFVHWDDKQRHLRLTYVFDRTPSDADEEELELSMAELIADFPDIVSADTVKALSRTNVDAGEHQVYERAPA